MHRPRRPSAAQFSARAWSALVPRRRADAGEVGGVGSDLEDLELLGFLLMQGSGHVEGGSAGEAVLRLQGAHHARDAVLVPAVQEGAAGEAAKSSTSTGSTSLRRNASAIAMRPRENSIVSGVDRKHRLDSLTTSSPQPCVNHNWTRITFEFTRVRRLAKPAVARRVQRRVGRHPWTTSRPDILHEGGNLHELDGRAYTVDTGYSLEKLIGEERFSCVL